MSTPKVIKLAEAYCFTFLRQQFVIAAYGLAPACAYAVTRVYFGMSMLVSGVASVICVGLLIASPAVFRRNRPARQFTGAVIFAFGSSLLVVGAMVFVHAGASFAHRVGLNLVHLFELVILIIFLLLAIVQYIMRKFRRDMCKRNGDGIEHEDN